MEYTLVIKSYTDENYRHVIATRSMKEQLARSEDGVNINLNHADFYTTIEESDASDE